MLKIEIFTDGACWGNPGPGGWGAVLRYPAHEEYLSGFEPHTTNNRMELMAAIEALKVLPNPCEISLTTDSQYVKNGITLWIENWKKRNWKTAGRQPVKNSDLWKLLYQEEQRHKVQWHWIRGHTGHIYNEKADQLANQAIKNGLTKDNAVVV
jgi:ribonuclease HI